MNKEKKKMNVKNKLKWLVKKIIRKEGMLGMNIRKKKEVGYYKIRIKIIKIT
jgi:hypothetical protein